MIKIEINIIGDILKSSMALHEFGRPVYRAIEEKISMLEAPTLFVINLRGADPMDYEFVNISFSGIVEQYLSNPNLFIAFKAGKWETEELFIGLTKILKLKKKVSQTDIDALKEHGINLITISDTDETSYVTNLSSKHMEVLQKIQESDKTSSADIQQTFSLNAEDTSEIILDLIKCKFIYSTVGPVYHSINSLIK